MLSGLVATSFLPFGMEPPLYEQTVVSEVETQCSQPASPGEELPPYEWRLSWSRELPAWKRVSVE